MASKEATILLLDVSHSMWRTSDAYGKSNLENACFAIMQILHSKVVSGRKTDLVSLVLVGTNNTSNILHNNENDGYEHITEHSPIQMANLALMKYVDSECEKGLEQTADLLDGIVVSEAMLELHCKHLKWLKNIFVFSDLSSSFSHDKHEEILARAKDYGTRINIIDFGSSKTPAYVKNSTLLSTFAEQTYGETYPATEALTLLASLRARSVNPTTLIRTPLALGNSLEDPSAAINIPIYAYAKVKESKLPSAKKYSRAAHESADTDPVSLAFKGEVVMERTYKVKDPVAEGDEDIGDGIELDREKDLIKAYRYGKDLIPFSEEDRDAMKLTSEKGFKVLGFIKSYEVSRELFLNDPIQIIPDPSSNSHAKRLFETLTLSLQAKESYALVRYVRIENATPKLGVLIPHIGKRIWCAWIQIPFKEDIREYTFTTLMPLLLNPTPSQSQASASSSSTLASMILSQAGLEKTGRAKRVKMNFRTVDTEEADARIDAWIDSMDLMEAIEDDGQRMEAYKPIDVFNPTYQRLYQCITYRAMNPDKKGLPPLDPRFVAGVLPMPEMVKKAKRAFDAMKDSFVITKIEEQKEDSRKRFKRGLETAKELESAILSATTAPASTTSFTSLNQILVTSISTSTPKEDFLALLSQNSANAIAAFAQLSDRVMQFLRESIGAQYYQKTLECIQTMRRESVKLGRFQEYNSLLASVKDLCKTYDRITPFWVLLKREEAVGLIHDGEVTGSNISTVGANEFFEEKVADAGAIQEENEAVEDEQDLLDMLD